MPKVYVANNNQSSIDAGTLLSHQSLNLLANKDDIVEWVNALFANKKRNSLTIVMLVDAISIYLEARTVSQEALFLHSDRGMQPHPALTVLQQQTRLISSLLKDLDTKPSIELLKTVNQ